MIVIARAEPKRISVAVPSLTMEFIKTFVPVGLVKDERGIVGAWIVVIAGVAARFVGNVLVSTEAVIHVAVRTKDGLPFGGRKKVVIWNKEDVENLPSLAAEFAHDMLEGKVSKEELETFPRCLDTLGVVQLPGLPYHGTAERRLDGGRRIMPEVAVVIGGLMNALYPITRRSMEMAVTEHVHATSMAFAATLDPEAIAYTNRMSDPGLCLWDICIDDDVWRGIDATFTPNAHLRRHLTVAGKHHEVLTSLWRVEPECFASDTAGVLAKAIGHAYGRQEDSVQALRAYLDCGAMIDEACKDETWRIHTGFFNYLCDMSDGRPANTISPWAGILSNQTKLASVVACLPRDWIPETQDEWNALASLVAPLRRALRIKPRSVQNSVFINAKGRWTDYAERLTTAAGAVQLYDAIDSIDDMARAFDRQVLRPCLARIGHIIVGRYPAFEDLSSARSLLFDGRSLPRLLEQSAKWHSIQGAIDDEVAKMSPHLHLEVKWAPCFQDWTTPDGKFSVKVMTTQRELTEDGRRGANPDGTDGLAHCVGGMADDCRYLGHRILSVRAELQDGRFQRLSTVEVAADWVNDRRTLKVVQHSGKRNGSPSAEAMETLKGYLARCVDGSLLVRWDECETQQHVEGTLETVCGYDWRESGNVEKVIELWTPCLPRRLRAMTPEDMATTALATSELQRKEMVS